MTAVRKVLRTLVVLVAASGLTMALGNLAARSNTQIHRINHTSEQRQ